MTSQSTGTRTGEIPLPRVHTALARTSRVLAFGAIVALAGGCSPTTAGGSGSGVDSGSGADCYVKPDGGTQPLKCANDGDCGPGARCDKALLPPTCVQLYCLAEGAPCNDDAQCKTGTRCKDSACTACDICGADCVDLRTDPKNCGECGKVVPSGFRCINGEASDACTNLSLADAPAVAWECRTSAPKDVVGGKKVTDGTYVLTARDSKLAECPWGTGEGARQQWVIRVSGTTWEFAIRNDDDGILRTVVGEDKGDSKSLRLWTTCTRNFGSASYYLWDYDPLDGGGFRLLDDASTERIFMPK